MTKRKFLLQGIALTAFSLFFRITNIGYRAYLSGKIGAEGMGLYQLIFSVFLLAITLSTSGISLAVTRMVTAAIAANRRCTVRSVVTQCFLFCLTVSCTIAVWLLCFSDCAAAHILGNAGAAPSLRILALGLPFMSQCTCMKGYFLAVDESLSTSWSDAVEQVLTIFSAVVLFWYFAPQSIEAACFAAMIASTFGEAVSFLAGFLIYRRSLKRNTPKEKEQATGVLHGMFHIAVPCTLSSAARSLLSTAENLLIPRELGITIDKALKSSDLRALYENDENVRRLIDLSRKVEGMPRHASTHAAGVVITRDTVESYVPLARNDESIVTQFTMTTLEELGLLKIDFLGLRTLTVIDYAKRSIKKRIPDFSEDMIDYEDEEVFKMLSSGKTEGVFQFESAGMRSVLMGLKPQSIEDLIAVISLYRPGPMDSIPTYIANRHDPSKIRYKTPMLEGILKVTYGCMIYQEQVMEIFRTLAGYSYGRADIVRRAMSKKKHDVMERERHNFIYGLVNEDGTVECEGAVKRGVDEKTANDIFNDMSSFASYAFNKSHAAAYAFVAYTTAWLKCHYPCEFMAALISSVLDDTPKVAEYIAECSRLGIEVVPPHVNVSSERFTPKDGKIYFGLLAVRNVGAGFIREIERERETGGEFKSFYSFCKRMQDKEFNKRAVESLIKCGALDGLGANRRQMLYAFPEISAQLENDRRRNIDGQLGFFDAAPSEAPQGEYKMPTLEEMDKRELLRLEKEMTGLYLMGHPMAEYEQLAERLGCANTADLRNADEVGGIYKDESRVDLLCIITNVRKKITKNNTTMAFITAEDVFGSIEVIVFPKIYERQTQLFTEGNVILIHGRLSVREDEEAKLVCESAEPCPPADAKRKVSEQVRQASNAVTQPQKKAAKTPGLFLRFASENCPEIERAQRVLDFFDGNKTVYFYYCDTKKYIRQPYSHSADVNAPMLKELRRILGEENVIYIDDRQGGQ